MHGRYLLYKQRYDKPEKLQSVVTGGWGDDMYGHYLLYKQRYNKPEKFLC